MTKRKLVTTELVTVGAQRGQWLCRSWDGMPLVVRESEVEARKAGITMALKYAGAACLDVSRFDIDWTEEP